MVHFNPEFPDNHGLPPGLRAKIEAALEGKGMADMEDLNAFFNKAFESHNNTPDPEMGGFTPGMLFALQRSEWDSPECPLKLSDALGIDQLQGASGFRRTRAFLCAVGDSGGIQATAKGNLPRSFVNEMVDVFLDEKEKALTFQMNKVLNELDVFPLHEARLHCKLSGLIGLRKGKFTLTKKARGLLAPEAAGKLYKTLFMSYFQQYNIGYAFGGIDLDWLQHEAGYVLRPLQLLADKWIEMNEIAPQLLHPMIEERLENELKAAPYQTITDELERYFLKPFEAWGLLEVERTKEGYYDVIQRIRKTEIFDQFVHFDSGTRSGH